MEKATSCDAGSLYFAGLDSAMSDLPEPELQSRPLRWR
jgi:hypothetical protein